MSGLENIINSLANVEMKRVLAAKVILIDFKIKNSCALLNLSDSFVSK